MEHRYSNGEIDLHYGDDAQISEEGYVPYGWQFKDENISIKSAKGKSINCFGMIIRDNEFKYTATYETINSNFIIEQIERLWKEMKARWIQVKDYENDDQLFYATMLILNAIGNDLIINFKKKINTI